MLLRKETMFQRKSIKDKKRRDDSKVEEEFIKKKRVRFRKKITQL